MTRANNDWQHQRRQFASASAPAPTPCTQYAILAAMKRVKQTRRASNNVLAVENSRRWVQLLTTISNGEIAARGNLTLHTGAIAYWCTHFWSKRDHRRDAMRFGPITFKRAGKSPILDQKFHAAGNRKQLPDLPGRYQFFNDHQIVPETTTWSPWSISIF